MVMPSVPTFLIASTRPLRIKGLSPSDGSSSINSLGLPISALPRANIFCSPPLRTAPLRVRNACNGGHRPEGLPGLPHGPLPPRHACTPPAPRSPPPTSLDQHRPGRRAARRLAATPYPPPG